MNYIEDESAKNTRVNYIRLAEYDLVKALASVYVKTVLSYRLSEDNDIAIAANVWEKTVFEIIDKLDQSNEHFNSTSFINKVVWECKDIEDGRK